MEELLTVHFLFIPQGGARILVQQGRVGAQLFLLGLNPGLVNLDLHCRRLEIHGHRRERLQVWVPLQCHRGRLQCELDLLGGSRGPDQLRWWSSRAEARGTSRGREWRVVFLL